MLAERVVSFRPRTVFTVIVIVLAVAATRTRPAVPAPMFPQLLLTGFLDTGANGLFVLAAQRGFLSLVSVLASLYPVATVVLAHVALGERLGRLERTGVATALAGVALVSLR
jgi:drug/metabolite transporter (DMT)-like permease